MSKVVFRRVPIVGPGIQNTTPASIMKDLSANEEWGRLDYTCERTVFFRPGDTHMLVFLEFRDNATSSLMKQLITKPAYLNGTLCRAVKTWDKEAPTRRCTNASCGATQLSTAGHLHAGVGTVATRTMSGFTTRTARNA